MGERHANSRVRKDGIFANTAVRDAGFVMPHPHCHEFIEIFYVESGSCRFFLSNSMYDIREGDFILIPPDVFHYTRYLSNCRRDTLYFQRKDLTQPVVDLLPGQEEFFASTRIFQAPEAFRPRMAEHLQRMVAEGRIQDSRSGPMLHTLLQELFLLSSRECFFPGNIPSEIHTTDRQIVQAAQYITEHYMDPITAVDIAGAAGYSPNYLSRKFRSSAGIGIHEYLMFTRLQHAARELVSTTDTVTDIALRCGFSDSNYFKDAFKKRYGVTPRAYRKQG